MLNLKVNQKTSVINVSIQFNVRLNTHSNGTDVNRTSGVPKFCSPLLVR